MKDGINIDQDAVQDQLVPEDLNSLAVGSYEVPDPKIRNRYFFVFLALSLISFIFTLLKFWINLYPAAILLLGLAIFMKLIENNRVVTQNEVIEHIANEIPHSIGYYSIAFTFDFSFKLKFLKPIWTVIVYDHNNPPQKKSIVEFDSITKDIISDVYTEDIVDA